MDSYFCTFLQNIPHENIACIKLHTQFGRECEVSISYGYGIIQYNSIGKVPICHVSMFHEEDIFCHTSR